jgi:ADP-heptose:LPS heptosyltransferase
VNRVLLIRLSHLGDVILTEPVVRSIRAAYPNAETEFLTREMYRDVVELFDGIESVHGLEIPGRDQTLFGLSETIRRVCHLRYDLVVDLHNNLRSRWIALQLRADKVNRYPKNWRARRRVVRKKLHKAGLHTVDLYLDALKETGIPAVARIPKIAIPAADSDRLLDDHGLRRGGYIVFAVGASHPTKHYPIPQWVDLAGAAIAEFDTDVVIVEKESYGYLNLFDEIAKSGRLRVMTGLRLPILAGLLASSRLTVSNDSGVMHLSAAVGTPTAGLFGPTHPSLGFAPLGEKCIAVTTDESCSPCSRHGASPCFRDKRYCFTNMDSGMIIGQLREVLDRG